MDFRILGPVEARVDGRALELGGPRPRSVLALLLLHRGAAVSPDRLAEDLWPGQPGRDAIKALQVAVSRLRRSLDAGGGRLETTTAGYRLALEPRELDIDRFEALWQEGREALESGQADRAAARLRAALEEWRGPPLADLAFEPFAQPEIARLEELRAAALEDRVEADLQLGRHGALVPELEALVARQPLRERLRGQLMLAHYRAGRQGAALAAYREGARVLDEELGLPPGPELERIEAAILARDPVLLHAPPAPADAPPAEGRRATATIVFTDLAGSTRTRVELGDEAADAVFGEHDRRVRDTLAIHGGREVKTLGDGFLAVFDSAGAAIACAGDLQRAIDRQGVRGPVALELRVGIGAGDVAWDGSDVFGTPVVEAQRLCEAAGNGRIMVSDTVRLLAGSSAPAPLDDAGELSLKGLERPVRVWTVRWDAERSVAVPLNRALDREGAVPLAGRDTELAALREAWDAAATGDRRGVFVTGEPGIGKTRLAAELAAHALREGGVVLYGRCDDGPATPAQPFAEALSAYAAACPPDELRVQLGASARDLAALVPALTSYLPGLREPAPAPPEVERLRLLDAAVAFLDGAAAAAPILLVLDDLHWADELSLFLLRHILRADALTRVLVLATYRDTEPSRSRLLTEVVTGLARRPDVSRIELDPLAEGEVAALLAQAGRSEGLAAKVRATTQGNPFFVGEVVRALGEDGDPATAVTARARDVVRSRLGRLPGGTAELLTAAAVIGPEFDAGVLAAVAGVDRDSAFDALEAAEQARLVRPAGALDRFGFAHDLVRQTIVDDLPAGRRVRLHARIAETLEAAPGSTPGELAAHFTAAGGLVDAGKALRYARDAGDEAAALLAFDLAAEQYQHAIAALARLADVPVGERLDLELARGRALRLAGDDAAHGVLRRAAADAETARDGERMAEALLTLGLGLETTFLVEDHEMVALLRRALALLPGDDSAARARLEAYLAMESLYSVPDAERRELVGRAVAMARRTGDPAALADVLGVHSWTVMGPGDVDLRLAVADELVGLGPRASPYAESDGHVFRYLAFVEAGNLAAADAALRAARATARVPVSHWTVLQWESTRALLAGRLADAEAIAVRGAEAARDAGFPAYVVDATFSGLLWCVRIAQGRFAELEPLIEASRVLPDRPAWVLVKEAQVACERGDQRAARAAFEAALGRGLLALPQGLSWGSTLIGAADVCTMLAARDHAAALHELLAPHAGVVFAVAGPVARALGGLALTLGRRDEAETRFRDAVRVCERMDAGAYLTIARYELGNLLLPAAEGRALLEAARASAVELGMPGWAARTERALAAEPMTAAPQPPYRG